MTIVYFVRHAHSVYTNDEYNRPLSEKGLHDAQKITQQFKQIEIDAVYSSPYKRAIQTVEGIASFKGLSVQIIDALKERTLGNIGNINFLQAIEKVWGNHEYSFEGGESNKAAQQRAIEVFLPLLENDKEQRIVIGTHGNILTLILNYFDKSIGIEFWKELNMPAIIQCEIQNQKVIDIKLLS